MQLKTTRKRKKGRKRGLRPAIFFKKSISAVQTLSANRAMIGASYP